MSLIFFEHPVQWIHRFNGYITVVKKLAIFFGFSVYKILDLAFGIRLTKEEEQKGSDLTIHKIESYPEQVTSRF